MLQRGVTVRREIAELVEVLTFISASLGMPDGAKFMPGTPDWIVPFQLPGRWQEVFKTLETDADVPLHSGHRRFSGCEPWHSNRVRRTSAVRGRQVGPSVAQAETTTDSPRGDTFLFGGGHLSANIIR